MRCYGDGGANTAQLHPAFICNTVYVCYRDTMRVIGNSSVMSSQLKGDCQRSEDLIKEKPSEEGRSTGFGKGYTTYLTR